MVASCATPTNPLRLLKHTLRYIDTLSNFFDEITTFSPSSETFQLKGVKSPNSVPTWASVDRQFLTET